MQARLSILDSCTTNNGGCDTHANCIWQPFNGTRTCVCKTGYTNTGSESNVVCTGISFILHALKDLTYTVLPF